MAKKSVKKVSRDFAQGELVDNILAPCIMNGAYDESTGSYPAFKGFDTRTLYQAGNLPDLSRSSPAREVTFVCFDFTEFECLETLHDPKSDVENSSRDFYAHVHTQSLALETLISEVRKVVIHLTRVLGFFWSIEVSWVFYFRCLPHTYRTGTFIESFTSLFSSDFFTFYPSSTITLFLHWNVTRKLGNVQSSSTRMAIMRAA